MRNGLLTTLTLLATLIVGCNKVEPIAESLASGDGIINFASAADWTKGSAVSEISDVGHLQVYSYAIDATELAEGESGWAKATSTDLTPYFTDKIETPFTLTQSSSGSWSYDVGEKYWPVDGRELTFFAHYPASDLAHSFDDETGLPQFSYTLDPLSRNNDDLVLDIQRDLTDNGSAVNFELQHALTKLSLQVCLVGSLNSDQSAYHLEVGETDETYDVENYDYYAVNGIVFYNLYDNATLNIDFEDNGDRTISWTILDTGETIELESTQGQTLKSVDDPDAELHVPDATTGDNVYTNVMEDGKAIFVLPQSLSSLRVSEGGAAPTAMVRVRRKYYTTSDYSSDEAEATELVYESKKMIVPAATGCTGWEVGQHILLSFDFDIGNLSDLDTPLTISSEVLDWTTTTVTADIHSNLYIYSSNSTVSVETEDYINYFGDFTICTNYDYNLRVPHHREELGGTITSSRGFLFCSDDFNEDGYFGANANNTNHVTTFTDDDGTIYKAFVPTLLSGDYEIIYADKYNLNAALSGDDVVYDSDGKSTYDDSSATDLIYEYPGADGYNDTSSRAAIAGVTKADIVYGSNGYAYILNSSTGLYRLLYLDPKTYEDGGTNAVTAFNYVNNDETGYHEIKLTNFASTDEKTVSFKVNIGKINGEDQDDYTFNFWVTRSTRTDEGLYVTTAIDGSDNAYGVNKQGDDPVYILRLSVDPNHLGEGDTFDDIIGVEMISNGGGMITQLFPVSLTDTDLVIQR